MSLPSGRRRLRWRPTPDTALALTALVLAAGGGGYALGAGGDQVITACVDAANGTPTQIITTGSCPGGQTALSWNQSGPQGSQGVQGPVGPAGKDAPPTTDKTVVALPPKPTLRRPRTFSVSLQLPGPGTYLIDAHTAWNQGTIGTDVPINCSISRSQPATTLDTLTTKVLKDDLFNTGVLDETAITTVVAPDPITGPVAPLPVPVTVTFRCTATTKYAKRILFHDWTLTATPASVVTIQKKA